MSEPQNPEPEQVVEPGPQSLDDLTEDQLRDMIDAPTTGEPPVEPTPEPEPVADEPVEPVAAAPVEPAEAEPEVEPEATPEPQGLEAQLAEMRADFDQERLRRQAQEERNQHLEFKLSRRAGEVGDLRQKLRTTPPPSPAETDDLGGYPEAPPPVQPAETQLSSEIQDGIDEFRAERFQAAAVKQWGESQDASAKFWKSLEGRPEAEQQEFNTAWQENLKKEVGRYDDDVADARQRGDVKMISSIVRAAYGAALADTRANYANKLLERKRTSADQTSTLKEKKLAASAGAQGTRPTPRAAPKRLEDMTPEEIQAEIDRRSEAGIFVG